MKSNGRKRFVGYGVVALSLVGVLSLLLMAAAQTKAPATVKPEDRPTPRMTDGHPDFSGFYNNTDRYRGDFGDEEGGAHVIDRSTDGSIFFDYGGANIGPGLVAEKEGT